MAGSIFQSSAGVLLVVGEALMKPWLSATDDTVKITADVVDLQRLQ